MKEEIKTRYGKSIPVFSSDVGNEMSSELASVSDMLQGNIHPYFSGTPAADAANWTMKEYESKITTNPTPMALEGVISEVGWPSAPASAVYLNGSVPGLANMQTVVDNFVCQANAAGIPCKCPFSFSLFFLSFFLFGQRNCLSVLTWKLLFSFHRCRLLVRVQG